MADSDLFKANLKAIAINQNQYFTDMVLFSISKLTSFISFSTTNERQKREKVLLLSLGFIQNRDKLYRKKGRANNNNFHKSCVRKYLNVI